MGIRRIFTQHRGDNSNGGTLLGQLTRARSPPRRLTIPVSEKRAQAGGWYEGTEETEVHMKGKIIAYWICTVIIALMIGSGGVAQVLRVPQNVEGLTALGYPLHFIVLLGAWKVLGALALLVPGLRLVKEWAYAGIFFDLSGAIVAAASNRGAAFHILAPAALILVLAASWALRPDSRRLKPA